MKKIVYTNSVFKVLLDSVMESHLLLNSVGNYIRVRDATFPSVEKKMMINSHPEDIMRAHVDLQKLMKYQIDESKLILNDDAYLMKWITTISEMMDSVHPNFAF